MADSFRCKWWTLNLFFFFLYCAWSGQCPIGWYLFQGHCYNLVSTAMSWLDASSNCRQNNAFLVDVESNDEDNFVDGLVTGGHVWIGLNDRATEGTFVWSRTGSSFTTASKFNPPEPNGGTGENCVELRYGGGNRNWNDQSCADQNRFICKSGGWKPFFLRKSEEWSLKICR